MQHIHTKNNKNKSPISNENSLAVLEAMDYIFIDAYLRTAHFSSISLSRYSHIHMISPFATHYLKACLSKTLEFQHKKNASCTKVDCHSIKDRNNNT